MSRERGVDVDEGPDVSGNKDGFCVDVDAMLRKRRRRARYSYQRRWRAGCDV